MQKSYILGGVLQLCAKDVPDAAAVAPVRGESARSPGLAPQGRKTAGVKTGRTFPLEREA